MGASAGRHSYGTQLQTDFAGGTTYATFAEVTDLDGPGISVSVTDLTNLNSPSATKEKTPGLIDSGQITFSCTLVPAAYVSMLGSLRKRLNYKILLPLAGAEITNGFYTFLGFFIKVPTKFPADGKLSEDSITIEISGPVTFSSPA